MGLCLLTTLESKVCNYALQIIPNSFLAMNKKSAVGYITLRTSLIYPGSYGEPTNKTSSVHMTVYFTDSLGVRRSSEAQFQIYIL